MQSFCPNCQAEKTEEQTLCSRCGHSEESSSNQTMQMEWAYSPYANMCLAVGMFVTVLSAVTSVIFAISSIFTNRMIEWVLFGCIFFCLSIPLFIVFARAYDQGLRQAKRQS